MKRKEDDDKILFWAQGDGNRVGSFTFADIYLLVLLMGCGYGASRTLEHTAGFRGFSPLGPSMSLSLIYCQC